MLKKGVYYGKCSSTTKARLKGELRSKIALILAKSDKEQEQAAKDIHNLRLIS